MAVSVILAACISLFDEKCLQNRRLWPIANQDGGGPHYRWGVDSDWRRLLVTTEREKGRRRRRRDERGTSLVEFAFVFPIFMTVVLGMFSGGLAYNRKISMTNATGEASRYGATLAPASFPGPYTAPATHGLDVWLVKVADAVVQNASGDLNAGTQDRSICVAFLHPSATAAPPDTPADDYGHKLVRTTSDTPSHGPGEQCFPDGRPDTERRVQILVTRRSPISALFFTLDDVTLTARAVTRFEATL